MRKTVIAAFAATMLAGPASATEWRVMTPFGECVKQAPANGYAIMKLGDPAPRLTDEGEKVIVCNADGFCLTYFRTPEACEDLARANAEQAKAAQQAEQRKLDPYR